MSSAYLIHNFIGEHAESFSETAEIVIFFHQYNRPMTAQPLRYNHFCALLPIEDESLSLPSSSTEYIRESNKEGGFKRRDTSRRDIIGQPKRARHVSDELAGVFNVEERVLNTIQNSRRKACKKLTSMEKAAKNV